MAKSKKSSKTLVRNQPISKIALFVVVAVFTVIGVAFTVSSFALSAKATIAINKTSATTATFSVQQTKGKASSLWVSNVCLDNTGKVVVAQNQPVVGEENGGLGVTADSFTLGGVVCNAYVWAFPNAFTPVSQTLQFIP